MPNVKVVMIAGSSARRLQTRVGTPAPGLQALFYLVFVATFSVVSAVSPALSESADVFEEANRAYAGGRYDEALILYNKVMKQDGLSLPLLFNMGNAFYRIGSYPRAILYYERALILDAGNPEVVANLGVSRKAAGVNEESNRLEQAANILSINTWTRIAIVAIASLAVLLLVRALGTFQGRVTGATSRLGKAGATIFLILLFFSSLCVYVQLRHFMQYVVTEKEEKLLLSPFENAEVRGVEKGGTLVHVSKTFAEFVFIKDQNGGTGWIRKSAIERIIPEVKR